MGVGVGGRMVGWVGGWVVVVVGALGCEWQGDVNPGGVWAPTPAKSLILAAGPEVPGEDSERSATRRARRALHFCAHAQCTYVRARANTHARAHTLTTHACVRKRTRTH